MDSTPLNCLRGEAGASHSGTGDAHLRPPNLCPPNQELGPVSDSCLPFPLLGPRQAQPWGGEGASLVYCWENWHPPPQTGPPQS